MDVYRTKGVAGASVHKCVKLEELFVYRKTLETAVKERQKMKVRVESSQERECVEGARGLLLMIHG